MGQTSFVYALYFDDGSTVSFSEAVQLISTDPVTFDSSVNEVTAGDVVSVSEINGSGVVVETTDNIILFVLASDPGIYTGFPLIASSHPLSAWPSTIIETPSTPKPVTPSNPTPTPATNPTPVPIPMTTYHTEYTVTAIKNCVITDTDRASAAFSYRPICPECGDEDQTRSITATGGTLVHHGRCHNPKCELWGKTYDVKIEVTSRDVPD
jgi:hypothetical protein